MIKYDYLQRAWYITRQEGLNSLLQKSVGMWKNKRRQKHYSYESLWACNEKLQKFALARSQGCSDAGVTYMHRIFNKNLHTYHGLPSYYLNIFLNSVERRHIFHDYSNTSQDTLIKQTHKLDPLSLPFKRWLVLQYFCLRNGLFKTANIIRQKAAECAYITAESNNIDDLVIAFRASIDQAEFEKTRVFLNLIKEKFPTHYVIQELEAYYKLNTGDRVGFQKIKEKNFDCHDEGFMKYICDKSIAIVGPAPSGEEHGEEIDSFDVVIRINYCGRDKMPDWKEFGKRVDISYYGKLFSDSISKSEMSFFNDIDFAIFKSIKHDFQKQLIISQKGRIIKYDTQIIGLPFEVPIAIYDILHFKPSIIKVFNINFFLSTTPYYNGYDEAAKYTNFFEYFDFRGYADHDGLGNINFSRNLWRAGIFKVDNACKDVINLKTYDYLSSMEKLALEDSD